MNKLIELKKKITKEFDKKREKSASHSQNIKIDFGLHEYLNVLTEGIIRIKNKIEKAKLKLVPSL